MHDHFVYTPPGKNARYALSMTPKLSDAFFYLEKFTSDEHLDIRTLSHNPETGETTVHLIHPDKTITYDADTPLTPAMIEEYELGVSAADSDIRYSLEKLEMLTETGMKPDAAAALVVLIYASVPHLEPELRQLVVDHFTPRLPTYLEQHWKPAPADAGAKPQLALP